MDKRTLAKQGRNGDTQLAHLTPGELVIPPQLVPQIKGLLDSLLEQHGQDVSRYTVGPNASKNPKTGLLEFWGDGGGDSGGESQGGRGRGGFGAKGGVTGGSDVGGNDRGGANEAGLAVGRAMMGQNASPLGYGRVGGETVAGTLGRMAQNMKEAGYRGVGISDTMRNMGVGYGQRAKNLGYGTALGSIGERALNSLGSIAGGLAGGPAGSMFGGLLGSAVTGNSDDIGRAFSRNVLGSLAGGIANSVGLGPFGGMAASQLANRAATSMLANAGPAQRNAKDPGSNNLGMAALNAPQISPSMQLSQPDSNYNPSSVMAMANWNPVQWANIYDPLAWRKGLA